VSDLMQQEGGERCGYVALIGAPNAGKSTLLNQLVGAKVAIVTHKVQTTRNRITGIAIEDDVQLVFLDTPGIFQPKRRLDRAMVKAAWQGADDAEQVVLLVDAKKGLTDEVDGIITRLEEIGQKATLALNKIDGMKRDKLLAIAQKMNDRYDFEQTFMISALSGDGVADLRDHLAAKAPIGPWMYPEDQIADITLRILAAEITREKVYLHLHDELPYAIYVETEAYEERKDGSVRIEQVIHVERDTQKGIVIGKGGRTLKKLGELAREEMQEQFDQRVHLFLHVRVTPGWGEDKSRLAEMGLEDAG